MRVMDTLSVYTDQQVNITDVADQFGKNFFKDDNNEDKSEPIQIKNANSIDSLETRDRPLSYKNSKNNGVQLDIADAKNVNNKTVGTTNNANSRSVLENLA